jgi:hypothetical protein
MTVNRNTNAKYYQGDSGDLGYVVVVVMSEKATDGKCGGSQTSPVGARYIILPEI